MPTRKMRVELFDNEGNRYTIGFEGQITRDKAVRLLDLVELLGGAPSEGGTVPSEASPLARVYSKKEMVHMTVRKCFPLVWFSSKEVQVAYEQEFREPIGLSTISTYLSRLVSKSLLVKTGPPNRLKYKVVQTLTKPQISRSVP